MQATTIRKTKESKAEPEAASAGQQVAILIAIAIYEQALFDTVSKIFPIRVLMNLLSTTRGRRRFAGSGLERVIVPTAIAMKRASLITVPKIFKIRVTMHLLCGG